MKLSARRTGNGLYSIAAGVVRLLFSTHVAAQTSAVTSAVPTLINFSGTLSDTNGKPLTDVTGVTFLLYKDSEGYRKPIPTLSNRTSLKGGAATIPSPSFKARPRNKASGGRANPQRRSRESGDETGEDSTEFAIRYQAAKKAQ